MDHAILDYYIDINIAMFAIYFRWHFGYYRCRYWFYLLYL